MAVSMTRKKALHVCSGHSNIKNSSKKTNCTEAAGSFPVAEMERSLALAARNKVELDRAARLARSRARCYVEMTYEDLQRDETGELDRLFVGALGLAFVNRSNPVTVLKKTSDDVRSVMSNFDEIAAYFARLGVEDRCPLSQMLAATDARSFPACDAAAVLDATCAARYRAGRRPAASLNATKAPRDHAPVDDPCEFWERRPPAPAAPGAPS